MSYKLKSLAYLSCFVVSIFAYYNFGSENLDTNNPNVIDIKKMDVEQDKEQLVLLMDVVA